MTVSTRWVDQDEELGRAAAEAAAAPRLALDTEADAFHAYRPRLCLAQLAWETDGGIEIALVDTLALAGRLGPLRGLLEQPGLEKIVHGAPYDVRMLRLAERIELRGLFDTQVAAQLLGLPQTSLAALALAFADVHLDKAGQKVDWSRRPLPPAALRYASEDVRLLFRLRAELGRRLADAGRGDWAEEEFRRIENAPAPVETRRDPDELAARIPGASKLGPAARGALLELLAWREAEAERRNVAAIRVLQPDLLGELALRQPADAAGLAAARVPESARRRYGAEILAAIRRGRERPAVAPRRTVARPPAGERKRFAALRAVRDARARELGLEPSVLCPSAALRALAARGPETEAELLAAGLRRWQAALLGEDLRAALAQADPAPGS
ncbi:MAG: HRDC domain-containing protein [Acidobacteria bacterium]|nr:HRDC domain-containing protein [Acidobacteriota bacterium]